MSPTQEIAVTFYGELSRDDKQLARSGQMARVIKENMGQSPGFPLLQIIEMPPRGHDLHQIVEHATGAMKSHVYRVLGAAREAGKQLTTALAARAVQEGIKLFTAESWDNNLVRLLECLQIVCAKRDEVVRFERKTLDGEVTYVETRGSYGGYCPPGWA